MRTYSLAGYGTMIADVRRIRAYECAMRPIVKPGAVVLDLGTGSGILALLACRLGARKVFAIEPGNIIQLAREIARANDCGDRIEFIQGVSSDVSLPERADAIISDIHGVLPLFQDHISTIVDARQRLLSPGGALIPQRETIWMAVVESPEQYGTLVGAWDHYDGLDLRAGRRFATNTMSKTRIERDQLLVEPTCWATLDYSTMDDPDVRGAMTWTVSRAGTAHGLVGWFDAMLAHGVGFSNAPGEPEMIFGQAFFPLAKPVRLAVGDIVSVSLEANFVNGDYVWRWNTRVCERASSTHVIADFKQSTFSGVLLSLDQLKKWQASR